MSVLVNGGGAFVHRQAWVGRSGKEESKHSKVYIREEGGTEYKLNGNIFSFQTPSSLGEPNLLRRLPNTRIDRLYLEHKDTQKCLFHQVSHRYFLDLRLRKNRLEHILLFAGFYFACEITSIVSIVWSQAMKMTDLGLLNAEKYDFFTLMIF